MQGYIDEVARIEASAIWITIFGIGLLIVVKIFQGILANSILEKRYSEWLSDKTLKPGMQVKNFVSSTIFAAVIMFFSVVHYSFPRCNYINGMISPTHPRYQVNVNKMGRNDLRLCSIKRRCVIYSNHYWY